MKRQKQKRRRKEKKSQKYTWFNEATAAAAAEWRRVYKVRNSVEKETEKNVSNYMVSLFRRAYIKSYRDIIIQMNEPNQASRLGLDLSRPILSVNALNAVYANERKLHTQHTLANEMNDEAPKCFLHELILRLKRIRSALHIHGMNSAWLANGNTNWVRRRARRPSGFGFFFTLIFFAKNIYARIRRISFMKLNFCGLFSIHLSVSFHLPTLTVNVPDRQRAEYYFIICNRPCTLHEAYGNCELCRRADEWSWLSRDSLEQILQQFEHTKRAREIRSSAISLFAEKLHFHLVPSQPKLTLSETATQLFPQGIL